MSTLPLAIGLLFLPAEPGVDFMNQAKKADIRRCPLVLALPIFPGRLQPSIVGRSELNFRVRDGNGWTLALISTNCCIATVLYSNKPLSNCQVVPSGTFKRFAQQNLAAGRIHFARAVQSPKGGAALWAAEPKKERHDLRRVFLFWWRRGESNPRPKTLPREPLRAQTVIYIPLPRRRPSNYRAW